MEDEDDQSLPCADKVAYDSQNLAAAAAAASEWQRGHQLSAYQCQYCQLWHLTTAAK